MTQTEILQAYEAEKKKHLSQSIMLDLAGMATYLLPALGEGFDILFAPFYGIAIFSMYQIRLGKARATAGALFGTVEELLPFADIIPTASFMWAYTYKLRHAKTFDRFVNRYVGDRQKVDAMLNGTALPRSRGFWGRLQDSVFGNQRPNIPPTALPTPDDEEIIEPPRLHS